MNKRVGSKKHTNAKIESTLKGYPKPPLDHTYELKREQRIKQMLKESEKKLNILPSI